MRSISGKPPNSSRTAIPIAFGQKKRALGRRIDSNLSLEIAGFAAVETIIVSVLAKTYLVLALAEAAVALALAVCLRLIALHADKLVGHASDCSQEPGTLQVRRLTREKSA
jgi:hypothetical protein